MTATPDYLAAVALELVHRIRDEDPEANGKWLAKRLPDPGDWWRLIFVLGAAVDPGRTWQELTGWARGLEPVPAGDDDALPRDRRRRRHLHPCGTRQAAQRHRYHKEPVCDPCLQAERVHDAERGRRRRAAARQARTETRSAA